MVARNMLFVPECAQPNDDLAFADRDALLQRLFMELVNVGNSVRAGHQGIHKKYAISGYMGVGKSALLARALQMLRDPPPGAAPMRDKERWLILYFSGKNYSTFDALSDEIPTLAREAEPSLLDKGAFADLVRDLAEDVRTPATRASELRWFHHLFPSTEAKLFDRVKAAVEVVGHALSFLNTWRGGQWKRSAESSRSAERELSLKSGARTAAEFKAELEALPNIAGGAKTEAGLELAAELLSKHAHKLRFSESVERSSSVNAEILVDALNHLFSTLREAKIPTFLVLDDLDDFASGTGASYAGRAKVLSAVLAELYRLRPNALLIGLRQEYNDHEINRHFSVINVPAMVPDEARAILHAWATHAARPLDTESLIELKALANKLLKPFGASERAVIAAQFLKIVSALFNRGSSSEEDVSALLDAFIADEYSAPEARALREASTLLRGEQEESCLAGAELDPAPFGALSDTERRQLENANLLRPALAGDPVDAHLVLDPLIAWYRRANPRR